MRQGGVLGAFLAMIADEEHRIEGLVNPLHHNQWTGPISDELDLLVQFLNKDVLPAAVGIADHNLRCPSGKSSRFLPTRLLDNFYTR